jgi:hypothetical protein
VASHPKADAGALPFPEVSSSMLEGLAEGFRLVYPWVMASSSSRG